ncbi:MAG: M15 family metallopeptidase [Clostridia bacterium]|nr:M15 family metallopeptidase [Clostridia bacterium]
MKKVIAIIVYIAVLGIIIFIGRDRISHKNKSNNIEIKEELGNSGIENINVKNEVTKSSKEIDDWKLILANYENELPEDFDIELASIDKTRKVDSRIIIELNKMIDDMRRAGISNIWVQSAYRDERLQNTLFNEKVDLFMKQGKTKEEAERLTMQTINKPRTSEHNLGLAVDFNYVNYEFESSSAFKWLQKNAEDYGFILRYREDKEDITKVDYEPWHWRYVGKEHAKKMNELDMCLEEYVEYLKKN